MTALLTLGGGKEKSAGCWACALCISRGAQAEACATGRLSLERESQAEAELTLVVFGAGDPQEVAAATRAIWIKEMRRIEKIGGIRTELQGKSLSDIEGTDRKSTRLNSSHLVISYAVFCLKKKNNGYAATRYRHLVITVILRRHVA